MTIFPLKQNPPNEAIFEALGRLIYAFTHLEAALLEALITALGDSDEAEIVVIGLKFRDALDRFGAIYGAVTDSAYPGGTPALCTELRKLNDERNNQVHSTWGFWLTGHPLRTKRKLRGANGIALTMDSVDPKELVQLAERASTAERAVYRARDLYLQYLQSPRTEFPV